MSVEHIKRIFSAPIVKREERTGLPQKKKHKHQKKEDKKESGKIDIKV